MKYEQITEAGYNLHVIKTDKFKTINVSLNYIGPRNKKTFVYLNLLDYMILYVTNDYKERILLTKECAKRYNLHFHTDFQKLGKYNNFILNFGFIDEKFAENGMNESNIEFMLKQFFNPYANGVAFNKENFDTFKKIYYEELISQKDDPNSYSNRRILEELGKKELYTYTTEEELKILEEIDEKKLYSFFKKMLKDYQLEIYVIGDVEAEKINEIFRKNIKRKNNDSTPKDFELHHSKIRQRVRRVEEVCGYEQSKLEMGFKFHGLTDFEKQYVSYIYSSILGGGADSLLFKEVREKNSLCYYIFTRGHVRQNTALIKSGVEYKNVDKVINLSKKCLQMMEDGSFDEKQIEQAKKCYLNAIIEEEDYINQILSDYKMTDFYKRDSIEERRKKIMEVTKDDIMNFAKKIYLDTVFVLKGENNGN